MSELTPSVGRFLAAFRDFERGLNGKAGGPVHGLRRAAIGAFERLGFPTPADEAWKHVSLSPLTGAPFAPAPADSVSLASLDDVAPSFSGLDGPRLVFVNGFFSAALSDLDGLPEGVVASSLEAAILKGGGDVPSHLARHAGFDGHAFVALNTAFLRDGAFIHVGRGVVSDRPLHVIYYAVPAADPLAVFPRTLVVAGENSRITVVETFAGPAGAAYLTDAVTEIVAGDGSVVDHYKAGLEGDAAIHVAAFHAVQGRGARVTSHATTLGGAFVRNDVTTVLAGSGGEATLNGLYVIGAGQHCDNYTLLDHREPDCPSHELYKGILAGNARAIFRGKIHVAREAQNTDAYQQNQNILLSEDARVSTKPQLEIYADQVKCSHGATVGQLDDDALFYLRARGIRPSAARRILLEAFAGDVLSLIRPEPLRQAITARVLERIDNAFEANPCP